jgi:hypothetical protein
MKEYEIYRGSGYDLVDVVRARTYEQDVRIARKLGYGPEFRIVEVERYDVYENYGDFAKRGNNRG